MVLSFIYHTKSIEKRKFNTKVNNKDKIISFFLEIYHEKVKIEIVKN